MASIRGALGGHSGSGWPWWPQSVLVGPGDAAAVLKLFAGNGLRVIRLVNLPFLYTTRGSEDSSESQSVDLSSIISSAILRRDLRCSCIGPQGTGVVSLGTRSTNLD